MSTRVLPQQITPHSPPPPVETPTEMLENTHLNNKIEMETDDV